MVWTPDWEGRFGVIEVYPAATRKALGVLAGKGSLAGLESRVVFQSDVAASTEHERDAIVCAIAGLEFLAGNAVPPSGEQMSLAVQEGWIWASSPSEPITSSDSGGSNGRSKPPQDPEAPDVKAVRLKALAAFLPIFQAPGFEFVHVENPKEKTYTVPSLTEPARQFVNTCHRDGWVTGDKGFNWPEWAHTADAKSLATDSERMAKATPEDLSHILTAIIRQDRFVDGLLVGTFSRGLLTRIVERASALLTEMS